MLEPAPKSDLHNSGVATGVPRAPICGGIKLTPKFFLIRQCFTTVEYIKNLPQFPRNPGNLTINKKGNCLFHLVKLHDGSMRYGWGPFLLVSIFWRLSTPSVHFAPGCRTPLLHPVAQSHIFDVFGMSIIVYYSKT